ncbi:MAG: 50S ribosomal protein L22 [Thermoanaerobaculaceae bacterium]|nr:50S ribosomal protein L22 [Thermoanaerobaculaceae bacterium]MDI9622327.1 50S ribosomal protein L22 [Acidobacteriota bacterium]NLH10597.1 50S ribosomal protein L22 [Holophagae bacterium]HPW55081.1 50S ribosomal protein L22 [Thermoanaerobaculaceae bacterium]
MHAHARLRYLRHSAQKVRLVADTVRGRGVAQALRMLRLTPKRCARDLEKVLRSAVANLEQRQPGIDTGTLVVSSIQIDQGPSLKRFRAASMGRVFPRLHRYCHVTVEVEER